ncbi:TraX family protein [Xanthomonas fragariae]|uniref:TraX family protein n=1 Tax=Xanthomonas fragariae TaxID=48664 RepID=UPI0022AAA4FB|nr:TraX family protein [Xanthomonas fragariae]WAT16480.1 TraX family protein [Xanthomonas fragariae]
MTSSGREALKWIALVLMTGDHVAKVFFGGYLPVVSELGRVAFPLFALVMAYNLAQPRADSAKSMRRLLLWGVLAQPFHAWAFGYWLPLNVLGTFALATGLVCAVQGGRHWLLVVLLGVLVPVLVDYQWAGVLLVLASWGWFRTGRLQWFAGVLASMAALCWYNGNVWALAALPVLALGYVWWPVRRVRWAFYGYYVVHLAVLAVLFRS